MYLESRKLGWRARLVAAALASVLGLLGLSGTTLGAGQYATVEYPPSTAENELQVGVTYTLWIPEGVKTLRGVIVHQHGAGTTASKEGATAAYDLHWQALAKKWDCALLGPSYHVLNEKIDISPGASELWFDPRRGSEKTFLKALDDLAAKSRHPELKAVPWVLWGHSGGGIWSDVMATLHPDRVVAVWMRSGTARMFLTHAEFTRPKVPDAVAAIPMMCNPGVKEKPKGPEKAGADDKRTVAEKMKGPWLGSLATFKEYRAKGVPIGLAPDPRTGHECGDSRYLAIPFLDACLAMRLPGKGAKDQTLKPIDQSKAWLAPLLGEKAEPATSYKGNPKEAVWLLNEAVAKAWMEYVKTGAVGDTTPPSAPTNVRVLSRGDKGAEITWDAEADLESGIRAFIVLRDGRELAQVPPKPVGKFGRPLFQSMTYHDTPSRPLPKMRYVDASAKPEDKHTYAVITVNSVELKSEPSAKVTLQKSAKPNFDKNSPFYFDGTISRQTLETYLDHSITMGYFLVPGKPEGYQFPYRDDDVRMIHNLGAKFIGRAIYRWGQESKLGDPAFLEYANKMVDRVHTADPEVVFQGCLFEQVSTDINKLKIPAWVFTDFGLPVEDRTFSRAAIIKRKGQPDRGGRRRGGVPIINNLETRLWFYYLAVSYINVGCEAFHLGQVGLIGADDKDLKVYSEFLAKVRTYGKLHARRHLVLMDGHVPSGGMVKDGVSLLDFNSFPMRIKAVPGKPHEGILEVGHLDAIFKRSKGCISPSGWKCDSLPYLVEFDNFGRGPNPNVADPKSMFCWGWDEISWFAQQPEEYRNQWLLYAHTWIKQTDTNGHLEMPGTRMISCPNKTLRSYFANTKSPTCPIGYSQEETIKKIWNQGQSRPPAFEGEKTKWHGFDRYDFLLDERTLDIKPAVKGKGAAKGQRQCIVVVPKKAAPGNPWSWRGCYWDHQSQAEVELLRRGFHIAFVAPDAGRQGKVWDAWYKFLTEKHGLAKKAAFIGMSKGGVNEFNWGVVNPDKVACIYADNPALYDADFAKMPALTKHDIPLLHICGSEDFLLQRHTRVVEDTYHQLGGLITVIVKEGHAHHPHSLQNAKPIADWIEQHMTPSTANRPAFVDAKFAKGYYYSLEPSFIYLKEENTYATARGPGFTACYDRYDGLTSGTFRTGGLSIIVPKTVAPGKPWVFTGDAIERDSTVEQALLAKGYHILIVSPLGSGMTRKQWNDAYKLLVDNGFSNKPVLKGTGAMAGEAYAWAVANPAKVSCIYARNPLMKSLLAGKEQPIDHLAALAKAGVLVLHDCGALDPWLDKQTRVVEKRYKELGGKITVLVRAGEGHFPLSPKDPMAVVDFIIKNARTGAAQPKSTAIPVKGDTSISLYGGGAASRDDCLKKQAGDSFRWTGSGQITWKVQVDRAGDYEVALNHAAEPGAVGQHVQISSGSSRVEYTMAKTKGVFGDRSYEMTPIKGRLRLEAGTQSIALSIPNAPKAMAVLQFRSLELIPVAAKATIEADRQEAKRARASTEWLAKAGYGLMFHWTSQSVGKDGTHKSYARAVDDFDVKRFAEMVKATGAGYVILTIGHAESYCPAPLKAWEKYHSGKTTRRDLIAEMADALNAKGIKLMCYLNAASLTGYPRASEEKFTRIMTEVVTEFGQRYKEKVAGYWIDCCYQAKEKYPGFSFREFFKACKVGNPNRILALNSWIYPNVSEWQEYWAGETASPVGLPLNGTTQEHGPGAGLRYHALLIMEPYWVQQKVEMPRPRFTAKQLGDYISQCKANGGAVTINLGIYQEGTVDPNAVDVLKEIRKRVQ